MSKGGWRTRDDRGMVVSKREKSCACELDFNSAVMYNIFQRGKMIGQVGEEKWLLTNRSTDCPSGDAALSYFPRGDSLGLAVAGGG